MSLIRRSFPGALVFATVGATALDNGGFFPTSWGWPTLLFLLTAVVVLIVADRVRLGRLDLVLISALGTFVCWSALSALWAPGAELPVEAAELALMYAAATAAFLLLDSASLPLGVVCAVTPIAAYSLATRLVPDHVGTYEPSVGGYQLAGPTGYQNCLGMLCTLSALIALGLVVHANRLLVRAAAGGSLIILIPTLYFTFSRGAAAALLIGLVFAAALERQRLRFLTVVFASLALPLLGAWLASRSAPLTRSGAPLSAAAHDGHRLAFVLVLLGVLQCGGIALFSARERRLRIAPAVRRAYVGVLWLAVTVSIVAAFVRIGNPVTFVNHATDAFSTESPASGGNLNRRLLTLSGHTRSDYWAVAWREVRANPELGGGGETFRRYWLRYRPLPAGALNAHNLYLETLAELGPIGLALLLIALAAPLVAVSARGHALVPLTAGAYVAALAHAAIDWDWQLPTVTLSTLALGAALVISARDPHVQHALNRLQRAGALVAMAALVAFVFAAQLGNDALAASERAATGGRYRTALADARKARAFMPWAASPWRQMGEAQLAEGDVADARQSFRRAIARDDSDWSSWLELALTVKGRARHDALAEASRLNPLGLTPATPGR